MRLTAAALAVLLAFSANSNAGATDPAVPLEPDGFWTGPMQGVVPATIAGGSVVGTGELAALIAEHGPILVDVAPTPHKPDSVAAEAWAPPPHRSLPGSVWLADMGDGEIAPQADSWFRARLSAITDGDLSRPVVVFCHPNCWASWNAAKRTISYGYTRVYWYPEGVEGWQDSGRATAVVEAEKAPR